MVASNTARSVAPCALRSAGVPGTPESALSPQRQLALLTRMAQLAATGKTQFIIATHSPVLLTFPDADIVSVDNVPFRSVKLEDTAHYQSTRGILETPERYWRDLGDSRPDRDGR
jgi:predicted ATPase